MNVVHWPPPPPILWDGVPDGDLWGIVVTTYIESDADLTPGVRRKIAEAVNVETARLRGIVGRNRSKFEQLKERLETAEKDREIYKRRWKAKPAKREDPAVDMLQDLFGTGGWPR